MQENITSANLKQHYGRSFKKTIRLEQLGLEIAMFLLCLGALRTGHESFTLNWMYLLVVLNGFLLVVSRRLNLRTAELYLFVAVSAVEIPLQWLVGEYFGLGSAISGLLSLAMTVILVSQLVRIGYEICLWRVLNGFAIFSTVCLFTQIGALFFGIRLDKVPYLGDFFFKAWEFSSAFRPCATFSEPSHYAELVLLSVFYYLFIDFKKFHLIFLIAGLCVSTSGLGIICSGLLVLFYILHLDRFANVSTARKNAVILICFALGIGVLIWAQDSTLWIVQRLMSGGTSSVRVLRSLDLFRIMDFGEKLFGIGNQNQMLYLNHYGIVLAHDTTETLVNREFAQTLGYILCTTGILGFVAFLFPFVRMLIRQEYRIKALVLLFLFVCFVCCIFARHIFAVYLAMVYATAGMLKKTPPQTGTR